jgi:integrase/recombinase XerD
MKAGHELQGETAREHILEAYGQYLRSRGTRTYPVYIVKVREFFLWCDACGIDYLRLTDTEAESWVLSLLEKSPAPSRSTVNGKISRLRSFYMFLVKRRLVLYYPFQGQRFLPIGRQIPRDILKPGEMGILLSRFSEMSPSDVMLKTLIEILYGSALRISEAESLLLSDLRLKERTAEVTDHKNNGRRKVALTEASVRMIDRYMAESRNLLVSPDDREARFLFPQGGKTTLRCRLNRRLKTECSRLGLKILTSHSFRHSCATHLLAAGAGIRQVQAYLGHESILSTQRYTHIEKEDLKAVIAACHPRENLYHD